jgi:hypothetical protein
MKVNNIFSYFLITQSLFLFVFFLDSELIPNYEVGPAILFQLIAIISTVLGGIFYNIKNIKNIKNQLKISYSISNNFYLFSYLFLFVGFIVISIQVFSFTSPFEYFETLFSGNFDKNIRDNFLLENSQGGLPGYVKLFASAPLAIFLSLSGVLLFSSVKDFHRIILLRNVALFFLIYKISLSLDRLSIMAVLMVYIFELIHYKKFGISRLTILFIFIFIAEYISLKRLDGYGILDFIIYYLKMSLVNFQILLETLTSPHTLGFSTFLSPLTFIFKSLGANFTIDINFEWVNNPAQFFTSYSYLDFGFLYFVPFLILGYFFKYLDNAVLNQGKIRIKSLYFIFMYGALSFLFVPAIRGPDFYSMVLYSLLLTGNFFIRKIPIPQLVNA